MPVGQTTSFTQPSYDYGADISQIERRRALAQALQQEAMSPLDAPQTAPGGFTPRISPFQGLAKLAQGFASNKAQQRADTEQRALAEKSRRDLADVLMRGQEAAAKDPNAAAGIYMSHPMTAQMGMALAQKQMEAEQRRQMLSKMFPQLSQPMNPQNPNPSVMAGSGAGGYQPPTGAPPNPFPGMTPQAVQLMMSGDPELAKMGTAVQEANKPINVREGGAVYVPGQQAPMFQNFKTQPGQMINYGPQGPQMGMVPGYGQTASGLSAIPNFSAPLQKVPLSGGQEASLTQPEYVQWQQTGQLPSRYGGRPGTPPLPPQGAPGAAPAAPAPSGGGLPPAPSLVRPPSGGLGIPGLTQSQQDLINQERQKAGGKALDEQFAKDYATFVQGGAMDAAKQLGQLRDVSSALKDPKANLTGPTLGNVPDTVKAFTNPQSVAMKERVEEVVQRSLRAILGAQFTEREGERLIARAYNPRLSEKENAIRVDRLLTQLDAAYKQKVSAAQHFERYGTLEGWKGKMPSIGDFNPDAVIGKGQPATIKFSDLPGGR